MAAGRSEKPGVLGPVLIKATGIRSPTQLRHWPRGFGASATSDSGHWDLERAGAKIGRSCHTTKTLSGLGKKPRTASSETLKPLHCVAKNIDANVIEEPLQVQMEKIPQAKYGCSEDPEVP
jgi:hypothetical protein